MVVLKSENVVKEFNRKGAYCVKALNGINVEINEGEFVGIMGPSGSGKTTLLNVLSGIDKATSGVIQIKGDNICGLSDNALAIFRRKRLGFVFQEFNLLDSLSVKENILLPMILDKKEPDQMEAKVQEVMTMFGILSIADKYPYEISGGEQQRTAVSRAVINNPDIIFADEPTGSLDSKSSGAVMKCFETLYNERHTILIATHDPFAASFCKRIIFIKDGVVNKEITFDHSRPLFYNKILHTLEIIGSEKDDI